MGNFESNSEINIFVAFDNNDVLLLILRHMTTFDTTSFNFGEFFIFSALSLLFAPLPINFFIAVITRSSPKHANMHEYMISFFCRLIKGRRDIYVICLPAIVKTAAMVYNKKAENTPQTIEGRSRS